jgi:hypothetical protein
LRRQPAHLHHRRLRVRVVSLQARVPALGHLGVCLGICGPRRQLGLQGVDRERGAVGQLLGGFRGSGGLGAWGESGRPRRRWFVSWRWRAARGGGRGGGRGPLVWRHTWVCVFARAWGQGVRAHGKGWGRGTPPAPPRSAAAPPQSRAPPLQQQMAQSARALRGESAGVGREGGGAAAGVGGRLQCRWFGPVGGLLAAGWAGVCGVQVQQTAQGGYKVRKIPTDAAATGTRCGASRRAAHLPLPLVGGVAKRAPARRAATPVRPMRRTHDEFTRVCEPMARIWGNIKAGSDRTRQCL